MRVIPVFSRVVKFLPVAPLPETTSAPMSRAVLLEMLATFAIDGIDRGRVDPARVVRLDCGLDRGKAAVLVPCPGCARVPCTADVRPEGEPALVLPIRVDRLVEVRHVTGLLVDGWLALDAFVGQCRGCWRVYWR